VRWRKMRWDCVDHIEWGMKEVKPALAPRGFETQPQSKKVSRGVKVICYEVGLA